MIGLTGGIASGKSTVSRYLQALGAHIVDADVLAREAIAPGTAGFERVAVGFPEAMDDGSVDRRKLGQIVFRDPVRRKQLEAIIHPWVLRELQIRARAAEKQGQVVIVDVPLLFETGFDKNMSTVWVVYVDQRTQIDRLCRRDQLSTDEARQRIRSQMPLAEKANKATAIIDNGGSFAATQYQIRRLWRNLSENCLDCP